MENDSSVKRPSSVVIPESLELDLSSSSSSSSSRSRSRSSTIPKPSKPSQNGHHRHRRRSIALAQPSSASSPTDFNRRRSIDFELLPFRSYGSTTTSSYTSLKDILPSSPLSPTANAAVVSSPAAVPSSTTTTTTTIPCYEISIRNRLVKQAAWAYLQPMSSSPSSSGRRIWNLDFFWRFARSFKDFVLHTSARVCNWLSDALWLLLCR